MAKVSLRAYNREIETMMERGQMDEAIAHCHHIFKTFPKHLETYRLLGKIYLEYKRYKDAVDIFSRVLVSEPNDFVANVGMSIIRDEENKLDDAIWHMERAFETQPSNAAIQGELQRLYGRRDGVQPPRIRMTRGALAHMYVQGELYPQAISEIKSVLKEDPGRSDMQVLLARACYRSGLKNEAAEAASGMLRRYPYCLDANRVLAEIFGAEHPENAQVYRQRVIELDPYAAQVTGTIFQANEVLDAAISLEHLDWNGQPVGVQSDWRAEQAIGLESGTARNEQPEWLKNSYADTLPPTSPSPTRPFDQTSGGPAPVSGALPAAGMPALPSAAGQAAPDDDIPDFLRAAGWGQSTGAFDESKPIFGNQESTAPAQPIAQGDMPDWVKAMAPTEAAQPAAEEEEVLPDWINKIGTGKLSPSPASDSGSDLDWMSQFGGTSEPAPAAQPSDDQTDWMKQFDQPASPPASSGQPDWMSQLDQPAQPTPSAQPSDDQPDWMKQSDQPAASPASSDRPDWMDQPNQPSQPASSASPLDDQPDWMKQFGQPAASPAPSGQPDWTSQPDQPEQSIPSASQLDDQPDWMKQFDQPASSPASNDQADWMSQLDQPSQSAPIEQPSDDQPDWMKQFDQPATAPASNDFEAVSREARPTLNPSAEEPPQVMPSTPGSMMDTGNLGVSDQERDDSFAWLENLAAKQGATEGLLTKPEDRPEKEPDWVKQAKDLGTSAPSAPPSVAPPPMPQPSGNLEELGKSDQERDDSFAWLENLAAKQGATEGLLTKPEDRLEKEPDWVTQAKDLGAAQPPAQLDQQPETVDDTSAWLRSLDEEESKPALASMPANDDTAMWLKNLDEEESKPTPAPTPASDDTAMWLKRLDEEESKPALASMPANDDTAMWLKSLDEVEAVPQTPQSSAAGSDLPAWMQNIEEEKAPAAEPVVPAKEAAENPDWTPSMEEPVASSAQTSDDASLPGWLSGLDKEELQVSTPAVSQEDLPAWLRGETNEAVAEPAMIEPTRATDWQPAQPEPPEAPAPQQQPLQEKQPEPPAPQPAIEEPKSRPIKKAVSKPETPLPTYIEPVTRKGTGMLTMPVDPILGSARNELSRSNIPGALETYGKLIKKARFLDEVIHDLREALYRYPVEVSIWQSLGDAYMRANRLQDALDAYTKAEELLR